MIADYLSWYKDLEMELWGQPGIHPLLSSSVSEPTSMLQNDIRKFADECHLRLDLSNAWGHPLLVEQIANSYGVTSRNVVLTYGVSNGIYLLYRALLTPGDHVVVESPVYGPLVTVATVGGAHIDFLPRSSPDYRLDLDRMARVVKPKTRLLIISNLHNPTGALLSNDELTELAARARTINPAIMIVVDEVYHDFILGQQPPAATLDDCFLSLNSLTKVYGLGCIHYGWILAPAAIADRIRQIHMTVQGSGSKMVEGVTSVIFEHLDAYLHRSLQLVGTNRELVRQCLAPLMIDGLLSGRIPTEGCICFPKVQNVSDTTVLASEMADKFGVYVVPGKFFGESDCVRIGFGDETERLRVSLERFTRAVRELIRQHPRG
ncbi:MAG: pyridoxal phosphate-dependent aminotransferase [bacterium]